MTPKPLVMETAPLGKNLSNVAEKFRRCHQVVFHVYPNMYICTKVSRKLTYWERKKKLELCSDRVTDQLYYSQGHVNQQHEMSPNDFPYPTCQSATLTIGDCGLLMPRGHTVRPQQNPLECERSTAAPDVVHAKAHGQNDDRKAAARGTQITQPTECLTQRQQNCRLGALFHLVGWTVGDFQMRLH